MITIQELLYNRGLDRSAVVKLVRHKDKRRDLYTLYRERREDFLSYQRHQAKDVFRDVDYIVSFVGEEGCNSRFIGVYKVSGCVEVVDGYEYAITEVEGYEDLKERVIVRWKNAISWHQYIKNYMEVVEVCRGLDDIPFRTYDSIILSFDELCTVIDYKDWKQALSAVKAVYLITDIKTGKQYVGSAYGDGGLWARWHEYVTTGGHGNNTALIELTKKRGYARNFQYSILSVLPLTATPEQVISTEQTVKKKLGTQTFGLNNN